MGDWEEIPSVEVTPELAVCVAACAANPEFMAQWYRLRNVRPPKSGLDQMIDKATGYTEGIARLFIADVKDLVLDRMTPAQPGARGAD